MAKKRASRSWNEILDALYAGSWNASLERFRSPFAFRGLSCTTHALSSSLVRLAGDADIRTLELALLRNFRKYAVTEGTHADTIWDWLALGQHRGRYALPLRPDLNRSRERFTLARRLAELPTPDNVGYCHIYRPLHFVSGREHTYESFSRRLPNRVTARLLDRAALVLLCHES